MRKIILMGALMGAGAFTAHSQTITAMAEQLIELKLYEQTTGDGYRLMSAGLDSIGLITYKEFQLHVNYFKSLNTINPFIYDQTTHSPLPDGSNRPTRQRPVDYRPADAIRTR